MPDLSNDARLDPSHLPGTRDSRVFVGGSYEEAHFGPLQAMMDVVREKGFEPIIARDYWLKHEDDIHDDTLALLHFRGLAIFELSVASGALMEIERVPDYGIKCLALYANPDNSSYLPSRMLSTFLKARKSTITTQPYVDEDSAHDAIRAWLKEARPEKNK